MDDRSDIQPQFFETQLSSEEEKGFKTWLDNQYIQENITEGDYYYYKSNGYGFDYDFREAYKAGLKPENGHWPDEAKKPNHPTFSVESVYAPYAPQYAGHWDNDEYIDPDIHQYYMPEMNDGNDESGEDIPAEY